MILAASLLTAVAVYVGVGMATGYPLQGWSRNTTRSGDSRYQLWLIQAGCNLTVRRFIAGSAMIGFLTLVLGTMLAGAWWLAVMPAVAAALLPQIFYSRRRSLRLRRLSQAWPDALRDVLAATAAGTTLVMALHGLAERGPGPLRSAFARFRLVSRMVGVAPALELLKEELCDPTSDRVIEVLILAYQHGGGLVTEVLRDLVGEITEDLRLDAEIRSDGTEQRIESRVVLVIPWLLLLFLVVTSDQYRSYYQSADGLIVVMAAVAWSMVGVLVMKRISRSETENRVLVRPAQSGEAGGYG